ncbi:hypothetical protein ABBQ32_003424 [Trebouxia sp. C0010 RCD-2024]
MTSRESCMPRIVASGTENDSKTTKVKAYWGKTVPVRETPTVPVWHRLGWNSKYVHREDTSDRGPTCSYCIPEHRDKVYGSQQTTYARHHTHTHSHSQRQQGKHRLVLQQSWVPGMNGAPPTHENHGAWCGELDGQLMHIHQTLDSIRKKSAQRSQQHQKMQQQMPAGHMDTIALRARLNASVAHQMEFFTAIQSMWCKPEEATHK